MMLQTWRAPSLPRNDRPRPRCIFDGAAAVVTRELLKGIAPNRPSRSHVGCFLRLDQVHNYQLSHGDVPPLHVTAITLAVADVLEGGRRGSRSSGVGDLAGGSGLSDQTWPECAAASGYAATADSGRTRLLRSAG
jgi:hypothetical protein